MSDLRPFPMYPAKLFRRSGPATVFLFLLWAGSPAFGCVHPPANPPGTCTAFQSSTQVRVVVSGYDTALVQPGQYCACGLKKVGPITAVSNVLKVRHDVTKHAVAGFSFQSNAAVSQELGSFDPAGPSTSWDGFLSPISQTIPNGTPVELVYEVTVPAGTTQQQLASALANQDLSGNYEAQSNGTQLPQGSHLSYVAPGSSIGTCPVPVSPKKVTATATGSSTIDLSWDAAAGAEEYRVYRSASMGGPYSLIGQVSGSVTAFADAGLTGGTKYYYVVRSYRDLESGNSEEGSATTLPCTVQVLHSSGFESSTGLAGWSTGTFVAGGSTVSWRGIQACTARTGTKIFRYGGSTCTANYSNNNFAFVQPGGSSGVQIPAGAATARLSFWHRRAFETGYDGGTLVISVDGTNYSLVPPSAVITGASYNGTIAPDCSPAGAAGIAVFTGTQSSFVNTVVDLDAACNVATGTTAGCAGRSVHIGFTAITDCTVSSDGWFLDDVVVTACAP